MPRKRVKTSKRWIESGPITAWMQLYCQWLASEPGAELSGNRGEYRSRHPVAAVRANKASFYAKRVVQVELVRAMEKRKDVREYFEKLRADTQFHAKELAKEQIATNFAARAEGLAAARQEGDFKAIEHFTRPFVDHALPKLKLEKQAPTQRFTINLIGAPEQQRQMLRGITEPEEPDEIEYEIVPSEKLLTDGADD